MSKRRNPKARVIRNQRIDWAPEHEGYTSLLLDILEKLHSRFDLEREPWEYEDSELQRLPENAISFTPQELRFLQEILILLSADDDVRLTREEGESPDRAMARAVLRPSVNNAMTISNAVRRQAGEVGITELVDELAEQCAAVSKGKMGRPEWMLTAQAHTLDALFNDLARLAYRNMDNFDVAERLFRLAFKAQTQGRATVEAIGMLKNPPMVIAKQANVTSGPQQVNNGLAREIQTAQNELMEQVNGERLDGSKASGTVGGNTALETVGAIDRTSNS